MNQVAVTAVVLFSIGFKLKDEGKGRGKNHFYEKTVKTQLLRGYSSYGFIKEPSEVPWRN